MPGRWEKKAGGHLPALSIEGSGDGRMLRVVTGHEMRGYEHYIIKHIMLDQDLNFVTENMFNPTKDAAPVSAFPLKGFSGTVYALSVCNIHDSWLNVIEV
jgi:superoxide reductase